MKKLMKKIVCLSLFVTMGFGLFAQNSKKVSSDDLKVVESLQNTFRSISQTLLPSVVEVDVTETQTVTNPFGRMSDPFEYFFGFPFGGSGNSKDKDKESDKNKDFELERISVVSTYRHDGNSELETRISNLEEKYIVLAKIVEELRRKGE